MPVFRIEWFSRSSTARTKPSLRRHAWVMALWLVAWLPGNASAAPTGTWEGYAWNGHGMIGLRIELDEAEQADDTEENSAIRWATATPLQRAIKMRAWAFEPAEAQAQIDEATGRSMRRQRVRTMSPGGVLRGAADGITQVTGEAEFFTLPGANPRGRSAATGRYAVNGWFDPASGALSLRSNGRWLKGHAPGGVLQPLNLALVFDADAQHGTALMGTSGAAMRDDLPPETRGPAVLRQGAAAAERLTTLGKATNPLSQTARAAMTDPAAMQEMQKRQQEMMAAMMEEIKEIQLEAAQLPPDDLAGRLAVKTKMQEVQAQFQLDLAGAAAKESGLDVSYAQVRAWMDELATQHPAEMMRDGKPYIDRLWVMQKMVADASFAQAVGHRVEALSAQQRIALGKMIQSGGKGTRQVTSIQEKNAAKSAGYAASTMIDALGGNYALTLARVEAADTMRRYAQHTREHMDTIPVTADTFDELLAIEAAAAAQLGVLWAEEHDAFDAAVEAARHRVADGVLAARAQRDAQLAGHDHEILRLSIWRDQQGDIEGYGTGAGWTHAQDIANTHLDALLTERLASRTAELASLGTGIEAVKAGAAWYAQLVASFGLAMDRPPITDAVAQLAQRRGDDLASADAALREQLAACATPGDVDTWHADHLSVPGDGATAAGKALMDAEAQRRIGVDREMYLALFSPREQETLNEATGRVGLPDTLTAPTALEIQLAMLREMQATGGKMMGPAHAQVSMPGANLLGVYSDLYIESVEVLRSKPDGSGGFYVEYIIDLRMVPGGAMAGLVDNKDPGAQLLNTLMSVFNDAGPTRTADQFAFTSSGWRSPTIQAQAWDSIANFYGSVADGLNTATDVWFGP